MQGLDLVSHDPCAVPKTTAGAAEGIAHRKLRIGKAFIQPRSARHVDRGAAWHLEMDPDFVQTAGPMVAVG